MSDFEYNLGRIYAKRLGKATGAMIIARHALQFNDPKKAMDTLNEMISILEKDITVEDVESFIKENTNGASR